MASYIQLTINSVLDRIDGATAHVYMFVKLDGVFYVFASHNVKYKNLASFGGFVNKGETVKEALLREFLEESHHQYCYHPSS